MIEVRGLTLDRGNQTVLRDISFTVDAGEMFMLVGPSGSGKSSLLRCINRLENPAPQTVFLQGEDITTLDVIELRQRVGMVFQQPAMFPGTVAENIAFGPSLRGDTLTPKRIGELLDMVALEASFAEKSARELSGGQAQRVAIARALANEPDVLLLDEPTSALDPIATHNIEETLCNLRRRLGLTMLWVSHMVEQAQRVGDRVLLLDEGRMLLIGAVDEVFDPESGDPRALAFAAGDEEFNGEDGSGTGEKDTGTESGDNTPAAGA